MNAPWIHVYVGDESFEEMKRLFVEAFSTAKRKPVLNGESIHTLDDFYEAIVAELPLIAGFGYNLDALVDLISTVGWGYDGEPHALLWYRPEVMLRSSYEDFREVVDIIAAVSKELLIGQEADPEFDPTDEEDWIPIRLDVVFACGDSQAADQIAEMANHLSESWSTFFFDLSVPVHRITRQDLVRMSLVHKS